MFASKFVPKRIVAVEISPRFVDLLKGRAERFRLYHHVSFVVYCSFSCFVGEFNCISSDFQYPSTHSLTFISSPT